ncbi:MAG: aminotransferase class V-fold PLP-dependent enzyme, partial [Actinomycetota bacterium]|nr:aminotransferase class V-fold PLP-dependent enzyme [Actinomycetota bacterium]
IQDGWADPGKLYTAGRRARLLLDAARETVAGALGARPDEVSFTASGTAAAQLAVLGGLAGRRRIGRHLVVSAIEHSCVLYAADAAVADGAERSLVPVDRLGRVQAADYRAALRPDTALACLISASHEVGTLQPVAEVAEACRGAGVPLYVDAAQSVGRAPVDVGAWGVSLLTASAHKWGGPPGVGVLLVRKGVRWRSPLPADPREFRRVPGFENVPAIVAAAAALQARQQEMEAEAAELSARTDWLRSEIPRRIPDVEVVGSPTARLPHLVTFSCLYVDGEALLTELDRAGFAVSSGSSCSSETLAPSHVLEAMQVLTSGNVRVSLHAGVSDADLERFMATVVAIVARLRVAAGVAEL